MKNIFILFLTLIFLVECFAQERKQSDVNSYPTEFERKSATDTKVFGNAPAQFPPHLEGAKDSQKSSQNLDALNKSQNERKLLNPAIDQAHVDKIHKEIESKKYHGKLGFIQKDLDEINVLIQKGGSPSSDLVTHTFIFFMILVILVFFMISESADEKRKKEFSKVRKDTNEIMRLAERELVEEIALLISKNPAYLNVKNYFGWTALMFAVVLNKKKSIEVLISLGADVSIKNSAGLTAYDLAVDYGMTEIAIYLEPLNLKV